MTPCLGHGACIGIDDGLVLARAIELTVSIEEALARNEAARKAGGANVQLWSREQGRNLK